MPNFRELYCTRHHCTADQFNRRVFRQALYPHARPLLPLILLVHRNFFAADRALIHSAAEARTMKRIREEVRDYFWDSDNRGWLRHKLRIRISGQRLKNIARDYLPESGTMPPLPSENPTGLPF